VAVPLFTLFGPDALAPRLADSGARLLLVTGDVDPARYAFPGVHVLRLDDALLQRLADQPDVYPPQTAPDDLAVLQYTSGTTRALPEAVRHTHRAVVTLLVAALYGLGLTTDDRYFCPSSPAWGHGLWHGTLSPLVLGVAAGAYSGRFDALRLREALAAFGITNLAAAPTVYRLLRDSGLSGRDGLALTKVTYTGEPMDEATWDWIERALRLTPCGMYGSTEVGVIVANYPGFEGYRVRRGALGKPAPGWEVAVIDPRTQVPVPVGEVGEIAVRRKGAWFAVKDRGWLDADGYLHHGGRSDDVIISAGWTLSALEIERALLAHPAVREAAVVGVADALRGQVPQAWVVATDAAPGLAEALQAHVRERLGRHEFPRDVRFVDTLPRTPAGKIDRHALRTRARPPESAR
jgi:acetyl-CoA synthetase